MPPTDLTTLLGLATPPVAIAFLAAPPEGIAKVAKAEAASCGYWQRAAEGGVFYTEASDHLNCAVGAHTHGVPMSPEKSKELEQLIGVMVGLEYLTLQDVAGLPTRKGRFGVAVYAPLERAPFAADVVMVRGKARQLMLLAEAAAAAGVAGDGPTMGRPTCAVLPQAIQSARTSASFGCVGNRVYTGADENDAWFAIPGDKLARVVEKLHVIAHANRELEKFHQDRKAALA